jgi:hypothetical protein
MVAIINIIIKDNTITITYPIDFTCDELPYGSVGYRNNGSSRSSYENLNKYWNFVDEVLLQSNISSDDYITLKNIQYNDIFYGILD